MSSGSGKYRGDRAGFGIMRPNLTEAMAIKGQQSFLRGGYYELLFLAVRQQGRSESYDRRWGQVPAGDELPGGNTIEIVFQEAARPAYIKVVLKKSGPTDDCVRDNQLKARSPRSSEWGSVDSSFPRCMN